MSDPSETAAPAERAPDVRSRAAFTALVDEHLDHVHDHVARWARDGRLAADAAAAALGSALEDGAAPDRVALLRRARAHVTAALTATVVEDARLAPGLLGAVRPRPAGGPPAPGRAVPAPDVPPLTPAAGAAAWAAAAALDDQSFSALDLAVRQRLGPESVAAVLDVPRAAATALARSASRSLAEEDVLDAYVDLTLLRAPIAVRSGLLARADDHFGVPAPALRPAVVLGAAVLFLLGVGGVATALRVDGTPETGPPEVVAAPVAEPTAAPTSAPTLTPLPSPTETVAAPSPVASATEAAVAASPSPTPAEVTLELTIEAPAPGTGLVATTGDAPTASLTVAATATGPPGTEVVWTSDLDPARVLLTGTSGTLELWGPVPCGEAVHPLRATATHPAGRESATAVVEVLVTADCPLRVTITDPTGPAVVAASGEEDARSAVVEVAAAADGDVATWTWTSDQQAGVLLGAANGSIELTAEGCRPVQHLLTATATEADGSQASDSVVVTVEGGCTP